MRSLSPMRTALPPSATLPPALPLQVNQDKSESDRKGFTLSSVWLTIHALPLFFLFLFLSFLLLLDALHFSPVAFHGNVGVRGQRGWRRWGGGGRWRQHSAETVNILSASLSSKLNKFWCWIIILKMRMLNFSLYKYWGCCLSKFICLSKQIYFNVSMKKFNSEKVTS